MNDPLKAGFPALNSNYSLINWLMRRKIMVFITLLLNQMVWTRTVDGRRKRGRKKRGYERRGYLEVLGSSSESHTWFRFVNSLYNISEYAWELDYVSMDVNEAMCMNQHNIVWRSILYDIVSWWFFLSKDI